MRLILVRHGESELNRYNREKERLYTGQTDTPLTAGGRRMAEALRLALCALEPQRVYASDLERARETALLATGWEDATVDKRLRERSLGVLEGLTEREARGRYPVLFKDGHAEVLHSFTARAPGGESYIDVCARCQSFLEALDLHLDGTVAVFSHYCTIRCLIHMLVGLPQADTLRLQITNCVPIVLEGTKMGACRCVSHDMTELMQAATDRCGVAGGEMKGQVK